LSAETVRKRFDIGQIFRPSGRKFILLQVVETYKANIDPFNAAALRALKAFVEIDAGDFAVNLDSYGLMANAYELWLLQERPSRDGLCSESKLSQRGGKTILILGI
jgi:hypothetical protein